MNWVRMGDRSWDAFEPSEGKFEFAWFDQILEQMNQAGIKVILDIGGSPAPIWLHQKYRSVDFVNQEGATMYPAERYMDDISDPAYREHLIRFADELARHYAHNPALAAIGYHNEIGNGVMSYSEGDRQRFIEWLKAKYGTIADLNKAWAIQRWSRHLNSFDEEQLPYADGPSPPERYLDLTLYSSHAVRRQSHREDSEGRERLVDCTPGFLAVGLEPVAIFLRRRQIGVPQHFLHASHIHAGLQMHRGERVPENVQCPVTVGRLQICSFNCGLESSQ
jgi:Beta-galactosidase